jgi:hypothetical protein
MSKMFNTGHPEPRSIDFNFTPDKMGEVVAGLRVLYHEGLSTARHEK